MLNVMSLQNLVEDIKIKPKPVNFVNVDEND